MEVGLTPQHSFKLNLNVRICSKMHKIILTERLDLNNFSGGPDPLFCGICLGKQGFPI